MKDKLQELNNRLREIYDLRSTSALLYWDQSTYMPPGGAKARSSQFATLARLAQEKFIDPAVGRLLDDLEPYTEDLPYDSDEACLVRITRRDYERALKIPPAFMAELESHFSEIYQVWTAAHYLSDFRRIQPYLEKTLDLSRKYASFYSGYQHIADPLIDLVDPGMTVSSLQQIFSELRSQLIPLAKMIFTQSPLDDHCLRHRVAEEKQMAFSAEVVKLLGYDFSRGRQDKTHHPFQTTFSIGDVRITTRIKRDRLDDCLYSSIHEAGHAMYEQGICADYEGTLLALNISAGMHESQSRLWENTIGRSLGFLTYLYPLLQRNFKRQFGSTPLGAYYRAINKVQRSPIRLEADEVTYDLHIMIRFDLEVDLLEGKLSIRDLPAAWSDRYQSDLGIVPGNHRDGVLQDVHWYSGLIGGAFQGYTLGNILSAQFYQAALKTHPDIPKQIEQGQFSILHNWLIENIYRHGRKFSTSEIIQRITGGSITAEPYTNYLRTKYGELYNI